MWTSHVAHALLFLCPSPPLFSLQEEEDEEEDGHRVCSQQLRNTPSPLPRETTPPLPPPLEADSPGPSSYLGLFPESKDTERGGAGGGAAAEDSDGEERVLSSYEHEVGGSHMGVVSDSCEEADEVLLQQHLTNYDVSQDTGNDFAELDPYLAIPARPLNSEPTTGPEGSSPSSTEELGVDVTMDMGGALEVDVTREVGVAPDVEGEESTSPVESVLYSH